MVQKLQKPEFKRPVSVVFRILISGEELDSTVEAIKSMFCLGDGCGWAADGSDDWHTISAQHPSIADHISDCGFSSL
jgi:hypothetical protein